jgi:hypothetical protein
MACGHETRLRGLAEYGLVQTFAISKHIERSSISNGQD